MIFDRHANLKYKYGNRHLWCRGYYVDTVGKNTEKIAEYIRNQLQEDIMNDQISIKDAFNAWFAPALQGPITSRILRYIEKIHQPHFLYRPPLKRPVFMPWYSCYP